MRPNIVLLVCHIVTSSFRSVLCDFVIYLPFQVLVLVGEAEQSVLCRRGFIQDDYFLELDAELAEGRPVLNG